MRLLLDTHVALWAITDDKRLPAHARALIASPANSIVVSAASLWEIATKHALSRGRRTDMPVSAREALGYFQSAGYELLPISPAHAAEVEALPRLHADPFDRLIVAQSLAEPLRLITHERAVSAYSAQIMLI